MMKKLLTEWRGYILKEQQDKFIDLSSAQEARLQNNPEYRKFMQAPGEVHVVPYSETGTDNLSFYNSDGTPRAKYRVPGTNNWLIKILADQSPAASTPSASPVAPPVAPPVVSTPPSSPEEKVTPSTEKQTESVDPFNFYVIKAEFPSLDKKVSPLLNQSNLSCINIKSIASNSKKNWVSKCIPSRLLFVTTKEYTNLTKLNFDEGLQLLNSFLNLPRNNTGFILERQKRSFGISYITPVDQFGSGRNQRRKTCAYAKEGEPCDDNFELGSYEVIPKLLKGYSGIVFDDRSRFSPRGDSSSIIGFGDELKAAGEEFNPSKYIRFSRFNNGQEYTLDRAPTKTSYLNSVIYKAKSVAKVYKQKTKQNIQPQIVPANKPPIKNLSPAIPKICLDNPNQPGCEEYKSDLNKPVIVPK